PDEEASPSDEHPVVRVTWPEVVKFCRWLTARAGLSEDQQCYAPDGQGPLFQPERPGYRLPTEAEWELACRAGTVTPYSFGSDRGLLPFYGRHLATSAGQVGQRQPNPRGLFDMHGNAGEWCQDWFTAQLPDGAENPAGPEKGTTKVLRGGAWES